MFGRHPGRRNSARQAVFTLIPVVMGAAVLIASGDQPPAGMSRLEATQTSPAPVFEAAQQVVEPPAATGDAGAEATVDTSVVPERPAQVTATIATAVSRPAVADGTPGLTPSAAGSSSVVPGEDASPALRTSPDTSAPGTTVASSTSSTTSSTSSSTTITTTTTTAPAASRSRNAGAEAEIVPLTNADRVAAGLGALSRNGCLDSVASRFAEQMARSGVLAHNSGAGPAVNGCRAEATWGDNVGMSTACDTATLEREWMASPGHRRNILTGAFTVVGVGVWTDERGACWAQVLFST